VATKKTAVKKAVAPKKKSAVPKAAALTVAVDYPSEGELVRPGHYSIRITATGAAQAQVRLDGGEWAGCREAIGHFWFDWAPAAGPALIEARARSGKGRWTASAVRSCVVSS
jgi:hypothetical protein